MRWRLGVALALLCLGCEAITVATVTSVLNHRRRQHDEVLGLQTLFEVKGGSIQADARAEADKWATNEVLAYGRALRDLLVDTAGVSEQYRVPDVCCTEYELGALQTDTVFCARVIEHHGLLCQPKPAGSGCAEGYSGYAVGERCINWHKEASVGAGQEPATLSELGAALVSPGGGRIPSQRQLQDIPTAGLSDTGADAGQTVADIATGKGLMILDDIFSYVRLIAGNTNKDPWLVLFGTFALMFVMLVDKAFLEYKAAQMRNAEDARKGINPDQDCDDNDKDKTMEPPESSVGENKLFLLGVMFLFIISWMKKSPYEGIHVFTKLEQTYLSTEGSPPVDCNPANGRNKAQYFYTTGTDGRVRDGTVTGCKEICSHCTQCGAFVDRKDQNPPYCTFRNGIGGLIGGSTIADVYVKGPANRDNEKLIEVLVETSQFGEDNSTKRRFQAERTQPMQRIYEQGFWGLVVPMALGGLIFVQDQTINQGRGGNNAIGASQFSSTSSIILWIALTILFSRAIYTLHIRLKVMSFLSVILMLYHTMHTIAERGDLL